ncbi:cytochrome P450 [Cynara cardunculus var. scolymus]|uniref:Cytochrome P450 n=1 Tax=Cynara cardunculus var. scolymus TaxID=59895 RepID=A0A118K4R9_CYNCS|nr:cytochrome P450 [Cynara cardunculus var. scolymus]
MAATLATLQFSSPYPQTHHCFTNKFKLKSPLISKPNRTYRNCGIKCSYSNGRKPDSSSDEKSPEMLREEKRRAELSARIASGEFTVEKPGFGSLLVSGLTKLGLPKEFVESLSQWINSGEGYPKVPEAKGAISAIRSEAFFIPLYELFLTYGGIFRLTFGPKSFLIVSDPIIAKRILKDNSKAYSKDVEMESLFSRLTLDIIGKAVFNYDFDSLTTDNGIVEAVYTVLREAEDRSVSPIPTWEIPIWKDISPRQKKVNESLKLINTTLDDLIAICKRMVDEEEVEFNEEYMNETDPSILHFLLASGDNVSSKQLRDDLMTMLIAGHETTAAVLTWTFYLLSKVDAVLGDRFPTIEDMKKLKYTTRVINESLRLYPQPPVLIRRSLEDDVLDKYPIKRSNNMSAIVAVSMLVRRFNFQMALGAPPVKMTTGATIHTTEGLNMTVTRRMKPPIVPTLETQNLESSETVPKADPVVT